MHTLTIHELNFAFKDDAESLAIINDISRNGFTPFYSGMAGYISATMGIPPSTADVPSVFSDRNMFEYEGEEQQQQIFPELFFKNGHLLLFAPKSDNTKIITIRHANATSEIGDVNQLVVDSIRRNIDGRRLKNWSPQFTEKTTLPSSLRRMKGGQAEKFKELSLDPVSYTDRELVLAKALSDSSIRNIVLNIAKSGKVKIDDARKDFTAEQIENLKNLGLLRTEYLIQCRSTSSTLCTISDKDELINHHGNKLKCPHCSRLFKDELIADIISPSEECKPLLDKSHWMTIWVTELVLKAHIKKESIWWNACAQSDEIDIVVDVSGSKLFFELKDREFGLGDAYPFNYRINRFGGNYGVLITADKVSGEAERFFREQAGLDEGKLLIFDKDTDTAIKLPEFLSGLSIKATAGQITRHLTISGLSESKLILGWLEK